MDQTEMRAIGAVSAFDNGGKSSFYRDLGFIAPEWRLPSAENPQGGVIRAVIRILESRNDSSSRQLATELRAEVDKHLNP